MNNLLSLPAFRSLGILAVILVSSFSVYAQKVILQGAQIPSFNQQLSAQFSDYQVFQISTQALAAEQQTEDNFQLQLDLGNKYQWNLNLTTSQIISPNYREIIGTENGPVVLPKRKNIAYTGYLEGTHLESRLTLDDGWMMGFVTAPDGQKFYIEPLGNLQNGAANNQYLVYPGNAVLNSSAGECGALLANTRAPIQENQSHDPNPNSPQLSNTNCTEVDFSVASAFDMINTNHDSPQLVMNHIISITNMMQTYFEFVPIQYLLNDNYVSGSTATDPFGDTDETNTNTLLPGFVNWAQNSGVFSEHDVAQVWTARNIEGCGNGIGLIGCAYINVICNNLRYNICEDWLPNSIKSLSVLSAHELGHNWNCLHSDVGVAPNNIMRGSINSNATAFGPNSMNKIINTVNNVDCLSSCIAPPIANCPAQSEFPFQEWIEDVTIGSLSNLGSGKFRDYSSAGYSDYTDIVSDPIDRANPVNYNLNAGFSGANPGDYWTGFIDYNQNEIFDLPEEEVIRDRGTSISGSISIPTDAMNGTTLLRVILSKDGYSGPCDNPAFGEVEDYLIDITGTPPPTLLADLVVSGLSVPSQANTDEIVDYTITLSNIGDAGTDDFIMGVFISTDDQLSSDDVLIGEIPTGNFDPSYIAENIPGAFNLAGIDAGDYFLFFKIDKDEVIPESQETNNTISRAFKVLDNGDNDIDLELSLTASVIDPDRFSRSRITLTLTNNSANQATNIVSLFNFSPNDYVVAGDGAVTITGGGSFSFLSGIWSIPSLAGGQTATVSFDLFTLSDNFNPCAEVVLVDQDDIDSTPNNGQCPNAIEDDEANLNNIPPTELTVDYVINSLDFLSSGESGSQYKGNIDYGRLGTSLELLSVQVELYLSEDGQLDNEDTQLVTFDLTSNQTNSSNIVSPNYSLSGIEPGSYTLIVIFDRTDQIIETNENNNLASVPFTVTPEETPDCSQIIGGDEILCSENLGNLTRLYLREGNEYYSVDIDLDADIVATSPAIPLVYDSTLVENGILTHKLADGTIAFSSALPVAAIDFIPNPTAATLLSTGEFLIGGTVPLGMVGDEPYGVETRVLKLNADLTNIIQQKVLVTNDLYPANLRDEIFALYPLEDGRASIIYTIYNIGITFFSNIQIRALDLELNISNGTSYEKTNLNSITETPCGDLLLNTTLFQVAQKGSTIASQQVRISKDGSNVSSFLSRGVTRVDRVPPREFANFSQVQEPEFFLSYFALENNPPSTLIGNLPQDNGDTTQVSFPFFNYTYGTRNGNKAILYGNLNGQITAVTDCEAPPTDGVDIAVELMVSDSMPDEFSNISYQVTVSNQGSETATGLSIDFDYGAQEDPRKLALVNNPNPDYSPWNGIWTIGALPAGEARTFELEVFVLPASGPSNTRIVALRTLDQVDFNQDNNIASSTIYLDDGATLLNGGEEEATLDHSGAKLRIDNLFPNPARDQITIAIHNGESLNSVPLQVFDAFGKMIKSQTIALEEGSSFVQLTVQDLPDGIYLIVLPNGSHQNMVKRFLKIR